MKNALFHLYQPFADLGKVKVILLLLLIFVITRLTIILLLIDSVYDTDETLIGFISTEFLSGDMKVPMFDYTMLARHICNVIPAVLLMPFFLIFGNNLISVKLCALFISMLNLGTWYLLLKIISVRAALLFSVLYVFSPTVGTNISVVVWSPFSLVALFMGASIFLLVKILSSEEENLFFSSILGFLCGLGGWIYYVHLLLLPPLFFIWGAKDKAFFFSRRFVAFALFFLLGLSPWLFYNVHHRFNSLLFKREPFYYLDFTNIFFHARKIFTLFLPSLFSYEGAYWEIRFIFYAFLIYSYAVIAWDQVKRFKISELAGCSPSRGIQFILTSYIAIYILLCCCAYTSEMRLKACYIFFLYPFLLSIISIRLANLSFYFRIPFLVLIIILHLFTYINRLPYARFMQGLFYEGDGNYGELGERLLSSRDYSIDEFNAVLKKFPDKRRENILFSYLQRKNYPENLKVDEIRSLSEQHQNLRPLFCSAITQSEISKISDFKTSIENAINICGRAHFFEWEERRLKTGEAVEIVATVDYLKDYVSKQAIYSYVGRLLYHFHPNSLYEYYKNIPNNYRYSLTRGFSSEELDKGLKHDVFLSKKNILNFLVIDRMYERLSLSRYDDEEYLRDIYAAYIVTGYSNYALSIDNDYEVVPLNASVFQRFISTIKDRGVVSYVHFRMNEELKGRIRSNLFPISQGNRGSI